MKRFCFKNNYLSALAAVCLFVLWGCLLIYTSQAMGENPFRFMQRQLHWLAIGAVLFTTAAVLPFRYWKKAARPYFLLILLSLVLVLMFGTRINGMRGWFLYGDWMFQPSEFAKGALLLYLSVQCGKRPVLPLLIPTLICCGLVLLEPDFGSAVILFAVYLTVACTAGVRRGAIFGSLIIPAAGAGLFLLWQPYARQRIFSYLLQDGDTWHLQQFKAALARGGITGSEDPGTIWANGYLPLPHTDSLYAAMVEASGLLGGLIVLFLFLAMVYLFGKLAGKLEGTAAVFLFSAGAVYAIQALLHISVNVLLLPATGVTLPLLSYGGSSLISTMLTLGIAVSAVFSNPQESVPRTASWESTGQSAPGQDHRA